VQKSRIGGATPLLLPTGLRGATWNNFIFHTTAQELIIQPALRTMTSSVTSCFTRQYGGTATTYVER